MRNYRPLLLFLLLVVLTGSTGAGENSAPDKIQFVRQAVSRYIFDGTQKIPLATLKPGKIVGMSAMYPVTHYLDVRADVSIKQDQLLIQSGKNTQTSIWFGGFNPFAVYTIDVALCQGEGEIGFEFSDGAKAEQYFITVSYKNNTILDVNQKLVNASNVILNQSIVTSTNKFNMLSGRIILQMLGSGLTVYFQDKGLPKPIAQADFNQHIDLRKKKYIQTFQSGLYLNLKKGKVIVNEVESAFSSGMGLADIRAITYENGDPMLDGGRLWYTMSIRGRALPHHVQGVFSMNPTIFDLKFEGVVVFDREDGLLRNEVASHLFFDRKEMVWRGITTGFSAFANSGEKKQLLVVESKKDPRFGFTIMHATPFGMVGDIEDPHVLFDEDEQKWRMLACENQGGYKAIMLESEHWNKGYKRISGPVSQNSTGTSIQKIGNVRYCFSGSQERQIYIYTYPDLKQAGTLKMDLPPWDEVSGTRVWPNIVQLPDGYPFRYLALMMDRFNYPGLTGPNWTYGALYVFHGY